MAEFTSYAPGVPCWVDLLADDVDKSTQFYATVFGWEREDQGPDAGYHSMMHKNGKLVAGIGPKAMPEAPTAWVTFVSVSDIAALPEAIEGAGGSVIFGPMPVMDAGAMAIFQSPDGSVAALWQPGTHYGAELANEEGTLVWNELQTRDLSVATSFYSSVFGWGLEETDMGASAYTMFKRGDAPVAGMMAMPEMVPDVVPSYWLAYFAVADADATVDVVTKAGGMVLFPPTDTPAGRLAVFGDPDDAPFGIVQTGSAS